MFMKFALVHMKGEHSRLKNDHFDLTSYYNNTSYYTSYHSTVASQVARFFLCGEEGGNGSNKN